MSADPRPEIATNEEWRRIMVAARKGYKGEGLTQGELGGRVGTSQNIISMIESGKVESSAFILPICDVLDIPPPVHYASEEQRVWSQLGHVLRNKSMNKFRRALALIEAMVEDDDAEEKQSVATPDSPTTRK